MVAARGQWGSPGSIALNLKPLTGLSPECVYPKLIYVLIMCLSERVYLYTYECYRFSYVLYII